MKIGFIGSQGSGKTTKAYELAAELKKEENDVYVLSEVARSCPFPINENTTREAQLWIMGKQITREQSSRGKILISDRTLLDSYSYAMKKDEPFFKHAKDFIREYMSTYDFVFYMEPSDEYLVEDGTRSVNTDFRDEIDEIMCNLMDEMEVDVINITDIDIDELVDMIQDAVYELQEEES